MNLLYMYVMSAVWQDLLTTKGMTPDGMVTDCLDRMSAGTMVPFKITIKAQPQLFYQLPPAIDRVVRVEGHTNLCQRCYAGPLLKAASYEYRKVRPCPSEKQEGIGENKKPENLRYDSLSIYLQSVHASELPAAVTSRSDCWYGHDCRTQRHNVDHSRRLNHICENTRHNR